MQATIEETGTHVQCRQCVIGPGVVPRSLYNFPRAELNRRLLIPGVDGGSYYSFSPHPGWLFVVIDTCVKFTDHCLWFDLPKHVNGRLV